jgi:DNA polymerase-3 subunit delta'
MERLVIYPWIQGAWRDILNGIERLPPSIMLVGAKGLGKLDLALETAAALLCGQRGENGACGLCDSCRKTKKGLNPDLHLVTSEQFAASLGEREVQMASRYLEAKEGQRTSRKPRQVITVDQVRSLIERLGTHSYGGGARIAVIAPASRLNINAANALLKILEEPPGDTRFILVSASRDMLPATIVSRVSVVECLTPPVEAGVHWLIEQGVPNQHCREMIALASGAPVAALNFFQEGYSESATAWRQNLLKLVNSELLPITMASQIGADAGRFLFWLERLLGDIVRAAYGRAGAALLVGRHESDGELTAKLNSRPLWDIIGKLQYYRARQQGVVDEQLFLEDVLIAVWQKN